MRQKRFIQKKIDKGIIKGAEAAEKVIRLKRE